MLLKIVPKLPMRDKAATKEFYISQLGFTETGDYGNYLMIQKEETEIHFFEFKELDPDNNYGQVYIRVKDIDKLYLAMNDNKVPIHPNAPLQLKPWGQKEFSLIDPCNNLLTFGEGV